MKANVFAKIPLDKVPDRSRYNFKPRGLTALLDAIGKTVNADRATIDAMNEAEQPGWPDLSRLLRSVRVGEPDDLFHLRAGRVHHSLGHGAERVEVFDLGPGTG